MPHAHAVINTFQLLLTTMRSFPRLRSISINSGTSFPAEDINHIIGMENKTECPQLLIKYLDIYIDRHLI